MLDPPDRDILKALHARLLAGDRLASEELSRRFLAFFLAEVTHRFPRIDEQLVSDGVIDAVLDYCIHPQQFDVSKNVPLDRYLANAGRRNVENILVSERRRKRRERIVATRKSEANVALDPLARNVRQEEIKQSDDRRLAMLAALTDPIDKEILRLKLDGVRETAAFVRVLGIEHLTPSGRRDEVKRRKDRVVRFLRRKGLLP